MKVESLKTVMLMLACFAVGLLLADRGVLREARGQSEGLTKGVICVLGEEQNNEAPIVIVDVPDQTILVYEYDYGQDEIELTSARTFRYDKLLRQFQIRGHTVDEVRQIINRQRQQGR